jgi:hypothetical protein
MVFALSEQRAIGGTSGRMLWREVVESSARRTSSCRSAEFFDRGTAPR